jgi:GNAT superfamily N-acetyltransferase
MELAHGGCRRLAGPVTTGDSPSRDDDGITRESQLAVDGELIGRYHRYDGDPPAAEHFAREVSAASAAEAIVGELAGWSLTTSDDALAEALLGAGAQSLRYYSLLTCDLLASKLPPAPTWPASLQRRTLTADLEVSPQLIDLMRRAYPPEHIDAELGTDAEIVRDLRRALSGERLGPLMPQSCLVVDAGRPVALALVNRVAGAPPTGGPWLTDLCRDPDPAYTGVGRMLLTEVMRGCRDGGEVALSLAVTEGNSARRLYSDLGFAPVATTRKLRLLR